MIRAMIWEKTFKSFMSLRYLIARNVLFIIYRTCIVLLGEFMSTRAYNKIYLFNVDTNLRNSFMAKPIYQRSVTVV